MARKPSRRKWLVLGVVVILLALAALAIINHLKQNQKTDDQPPAIRTEAATLDTIQVIIQEVGTIEPAVKLEIKTNLSGKITAIAVKEGDVVAQGQLLAVVEPELNQARTLSQIQASLVRAQIDLRDAESNLKSAQQLYNEGFMSSIELDNNKLRYNTAIETYRLAKNEFDIVVEQGIPLKIGQTGIQSVNIESPQAGVVIRSYVEVGEMVMSGTSSFNAGTVLFEVADLSEMIIEAAINEIEIGRVRLNQPVKIKIDAYPRNPFSGYVARIAPAARTLAVENVKVFDIEVAITESSGELRSGMTANIDIEGERREQVLTVPIEAVYQKDDADIVYVKRQTPLPQPTPSNKEAEADKQGQADTDSWQRFFEERVVEIGLVGTIKVEIVSGLTEGEEVCLENPSVPKEKKESFFR